jgi:glutaredoxin
MQTERTIVLYSKPGCHLCEDARALLARLEWRYPHSVQEIDIRSDPETFRRYDIRIPVMVVDGGPEIDAPLTEARIVAALAGSQ